MGYRRGAIPTDRFIRADSATCLLRRLTCLRLDRILGDIFLLPTSRISKRRATQYALCRFRRTATLLYFSQSVHVARGGILLYLVARSAMVKELGAGRYISKQLAVGARAGIVNDRAISKCLIWNSSRGLVST